MNSQSGQVSVCESECGDGELWNDISDEDRAYLCGPRKWPEPCAWCGGRMFHSPLCVELSWEPKMRFGKHKGKRISQVPMSYLKWLVANVELRGRLKGRIERIIECGSNRGRTV